MSLAAGVRLGPYELLGLIGAGGMGEVYRARDARLDRQVAIKVLDGTRLAFVGVAPAGATRLWLQSLNEDRARAWSKTPKAQPLHSGRRTAASLLFVSGIS